MKELAKKSDLLSKIYSGTTSGTASLSGVFTQKFSDEVFTTPSFFPGMLVSPWICPPLKAAHSVSSINIHKILTGSCLFGDHLIGIDAEGNHHPMTDPGHILEPGTSIQHIHSLGKIHAYELMNHAQLDLLVASLSHHPDSLQNPLVLYFHLPTPEYLLKGIEWYQKGNLSFEALKTYIQLVIERGYEHKKMLKYAPWNYAGKLPAYAVSPLDILNLEKLKNLPDSELLDFLSVFNLGTLLDQLTSIPAWAVYLEKQGSEGPKDFTELSYASYLIHIAMHAENPMETLVLDCNDERTICKKYQKDFPSPVPIFAMHWLPAVLPPVETKSWFNAGATEPALALVIKSGAYRKTALGKTGLQQLVLSTPMSTDSDSVGPR